MTPVTVANRSRDNISSDDFMIELQWQKTKAAERTSSPAAAAGET